MTNTPSVTHVLALAQAATRAKRRTIKDIRHEADDLGMSPQEAGEYIEREWEAEQRRLDELEASEEE